MDTSRRTLLFSVSIADCRVEATNAGGPGGQHQNRHYTAIRVTHEPSRAVGFCREEKSQLSNKRRAFVRMVQTKEFKAWHRVETARRLGQPSIDEIVERDMDPKNILIEVQDEAGRWRPLRE